MDQSSEPADGEGAPNRAQPSQKYAIGTSAGDISWEDHADGPLITTQHNGSFPILKLQSVAWSLKKGCDPPQTIHATQAAVMAVRL